MTPRKDFHAFVIRFAGLVPRIVTDVGVSGAFDPSSPPPVLPPAVDSRALWDTGASRSVVSRDLAHRLALTPVGQVDVSHAGGTMKSPTYIVNFILPNRVGVPGILVTELPYAPRGFDAIIGMDLITLGDLAITNADGRTTMSFRIPSIETVDYAEQANRIRFAGVGRNDPCPCGSGEKFKKCHGARRLSM